MRFGDRMIRKHIIFRGIVQGVGFRATAASIARRHPVTGWVRNLPDGSVEAEMQGGASEVELTLREISRVFAENIEECKSSGVPVIDGESEFQIRR